MLRKKFLILYKKMQVKLHYNLAKRHEIKYFKGKTENVKQQNKDCIENLENLLN